MINLINDLPPGSLIVLKFRSGATVYCSTQTLPELLVAFDLGQFETITVHLARS